MVKYWDVTGKVVNLADHSPIAGARVAFAGDIRVTDSAGSYGFQKIPEGKYLISVKAENYPEYRDSINLFHQMIYNVPLVGQSIIFGHVAGLLNESIRGAIIQIGNQFDTTDDSGNYSLRSGIRSFNVDNMHPSRLFGLRRYYFFHSRPNEN